MTHYHRLREHGHFESTRPKDWGSREKHALYGTWNALRRRATKRLCAEWRADFWKFVADVGERPEGHVLALVREGEYAPGNVCWKSRLPTNGSEDRNAYMRNLRKVRPEIFRNTELKKQFGITLDEYNDMLARQGGLCAICRGVETAIDKRMGKPRRLAVDHDHATGKVRALLCRGCNQGLGNFREDPELLKAAIDYLMGAKVRVKEKVF